MVRFEKIKLSDETFESASVCDVNQDGILDIVSGGYWYEGPDFTKKHKMYEPVAEGEYYDDFSNFPMDVTGNGYPDIITGGWWGNTLRWVENPGPDGGEWKVHIIAEVGNVETTRFWDVDGDGEVEILPNAPNSPQMIFKLVKKEPNPEFKKVVILDVEKSGHGLGWGDITGNGRNDVILKDGWLECPEKPMEQEWAWHPEFDLESASIPVLVHDVNGDGLNDLIVGQSHAYGLAWWEQKVDADGNRSWVKHDIDPDRSQYHDMYLVDIDNDGELELVTGKRYRAHCGNDPGADDPIGLYYFKINGGQFERCTIDFGDPKETSGCGIYFWIEDLDGNGKLDIIAPGKEGLYLFKNLGE